MTNRRQTTYTLERNPFRYFSVSENIFLRDGSGHLAVGTVVEIDALDNKLVVETIPHNGIAALPGIVSTLNVDALPR